MEIVTITTEEEYSKILEWVDRQFDNPPCINTSGGAQLQTALLLIKAYEYIHYPIDN